MTRPLRHTRPEIRNAAEMAREYGLAVRLEKDGAITFLPDIHEATATERVDRGVKLNRPSSIEEWRRSREGQSRGRA